MHLDEEYLADVPFFDMVGLGELWPTASLEGMSKLRSRRGGFESETVRLVEEAWRTPFRELSCEQIRLLLSQRAGLEWLAKPILRFVEQYPTATITNYPGELVLLCMRAANELSVAASREFSAWIGRDFAYIDQTFGWDRQLLREAKAALASARAVSNRP